MEDQLVLEASLTASIAFLVFCHIPYTLPSLLCPWLLTAWVEISRWDIENAMRIQSQAAKCTRSSWTEQSSGSRVDHGR